MDGVRNACQAQRSPERRGVGGDHRLADGLLDGFRHADSIVVHAADEHRVGGVVPRVHGEPEYLVRGYAVVLLAGGQPHAAHDDRVDARSPQVGGLVLIVAVDVRARQHDALRPESLQGLDAGQHRGRGRDSGAPLNVPAELAVLVDASQRAADRAAVGDGVDLRGDQLVDGAGSVLLHLDERLDPAAGVEHSRGVEGDAGGSELVVARLGDHLTARCDEANSFPPAQWFHVMPSRIGAGRSRGARCA